MNTRTSMRYRRFQGKWTFMYNKVSKHDHPWDAEYLKKNERSCSIMYEIMIMCDTEEVLRENVGPWTIMGQNTIIYETQKVFRKMYVHVQ